MAKKQTATLTAEERLQQALVPEGEQPYKLPDNWCWTYIASGFDVTSSKRVHKEDWILEGGIPFYRTRELVKLSEVGYVDNELFISTKLYNSFVEAYGVPQQSDILISGVGTIGVPFVVSSNMKFYFKDGNVIWLKNKGLFDAQYIFYMYKSIFIYNQIHTMSSGTTVDTYTIINANKTILPLPPLAEQQRIVSRIESLFAKLDEAKEKVQAALDSFETRKAAILHKAFTGELTAKWRRENGVSMDSWREIALRDVVKTIKDKFDPNGRQTKINYIGLEHIDKNLGIIGFGTSDEVRSMKTMFKAGDILYGKLRPYLNKHDVATFDGICSTDILVYRTKICSAQWINYFMNTKSFIEYAVKNSKGINLPRVSEKEISAYKINLPKIPEQTEIVRILDSFFAKEQRAKELCAVLDNIDLIKKSILARAFRGELGTNDPNDASALELLKTVL